MESIGLSEIANLRALRGNPEHPAEHMNDAQWQEHVRGWQVAHGQPLSYDELIGSLTPEAIAGLTHEQAAEMDAKLSEALRAQREAEWRADPLIGLLAGKDLHVASTHEELSAGDTATYVGDMRARGHTDRTITEALDGIDVETGSNYTPEQGRQARDAIDKLMGDEAWVRRLMSGDRAARRLFDNVNVIIANT